MRTSTLVASQLAAISFLFIAFGNASARILNVPDDFRTIQAGIDAAQDGDTVLVEPGIYNENINCQEVNGITLTSHFIFSHDSTDIDSTIVDGGRNGSVFRCDHSWNIKIVGFTLTNGSGDVYERNKAGGGILCFGSSNIEIISCKIVDNVLFDADGHMGGIGCGISINSCRNVSIEDCIVSGNTKEIQNGGANGGGIYCYFASLIIRNSVISDNSTGGSGSGGGIYAHNLNRLPVLIDSCLISRNFAGGSCGGVYMTNDIRMQLYYTTIEGNSAGRSGRTVYATRDARLTMDHCIIRNNDPDDQNGDGAVMLNGGPAVIRNCFIYNNSAGVTNSYSLVEMTETVISSNRGAGYFGGGAALESVIDKCLFIANQNENGVIWFNEYGGLTLSNSILWSNLSDGIYCYRNDEELRYGRLNVRFCLIDTSTLRLQDTTTNLSIEGNIDTDPLFLDPDNGDYSLSPDSPCIDAGDPDSPLDPDGTRADMGAFYFHQRDIEVDSRELHFPPTPLGGVESLPVFIRNTGGSDLLIEAVVTELDWANFHHQQIDEWPIVIQPDSTFILWAFFQPLDDGGSHSVWTIESNDPDEPVVFISMSGEVLSVPSDILHSPLFTLHSAFPNPFNAQTTIRYSTSPINREATLRVYDLSGRMVADLLAGQSPSVNPPWLTASTNAADRRGSAEEVAIVWDAEGLPGGIYLIRLEADGKTATRKVVLIR